MAARKAPAKKAPAKKKVAAKKAPAKKAVAKKAPAKKAVAKKAPAKKAVAKKAPAKKVAAKKAPAKKAVAKKAPAKKVAAKKAPAKKVAAKKPAVKRQPAISERYNQSQLVTALSESTDLSKVQIKSVLEELGTLIERHIKTRGCGEFVLPGMMKITTVKKPAKKARKGINPFTGEEMTFKAKPASTSVKVRPLKKLKEMV